MTSNFAHAIFLKGPTCEVGRLPLRFSGGFEGGISSSLWVKVEGGGLGMGCGPLTPWAHGKNLYFNGCGIRQAITTEMDTSRAM
jgi:reelin